MTKSLFSPAPDGPVRWQPLHALSANKNAQKVEYEIPRKWGAYSPESGVKNSLLNFIVSSFGFA